MKLTEALELHDKELVTFVGGGGKVTAMYRVAEELRLQGKKVLITTTTKMIPPGPPLSGEVVFEANSRLYRKAVEEALKRNPVVTLVTGYVTPVKLLGVDASVVKQLLQIDGLATVQVKGDGAIDRSLKAPASHEPVVPAETTLFIPMVGIDAWGKPLNNKSAHRPELIAKLCGIKMNDIITEKTIAKVLASKRGLLKNSPPNARIIPMINQVENSSQLAAAVKIADYLMENSELQLHKILITSVQSPDPVIRIVSPPR